MKKHFLVWAIAASAVLPAANQYYQRNLVADTSGVADHTDPLLINPWGICTSATSPFWTSNQGSGTSTLYNSFGVPNAALKPVIPAHAGSNTAGNPTGCVNNSTATAFLIPNSGGRPASFIFDTLDGSISGWANAVNPAQAVVMIDNSSTGAVYTGLAIATPSADTGPRIYAANFGNRRIDVYDKNWQPTGFSGAFFDLDLPADYSPFNVQVLGGKIYVAYAKKDPTTGLPVAGVGFGYVNVYDLTGVLISHLVTSGGKLNAPWGFAIAPAAFGDFAGNLLVGNFGDGLINAYDATTGAYAGTLQDMSGANITIPGLWALQAGNGGNGGNVNTIYFTAGPGNEKHGLLGSLQAGPSSKSGSVVNAASFTPGISGGALASVFGDNLAATQRSWTAQDIVGGKLPTSLDGVSVMVGGVPAYIYFISPGQINFIVPTGATAGSVPVVVTNNGLAGAAVQATLAATSPGFFISKNNNVIATHAGGTLVGATTLYPGNSTPAAVGETIELWGTGLGATDPPTDGVTFPAPINTAAKPTVTIAGVSANVTSSVMSSPGVYQVNITVGTGTPSGDQPIILTIGGVQSQTGVVIAIQ